MITVVDSLPSAFSPEGKNRGEYVANDIREFIKTGSKVAMVTCDTLTCERLYQAFHLHLKRHPYFKNKVAVKRRQNNIYLVRKDMQ